MLVSKNQEKGRKKQAANLKSVRNEELAFEMQNNKTQDFGAEDR